MKQSENSSRLAIRSGAKFLSVLPYIIWSMASSDFFYGAITGVVKDQGVRVQYLATALLASSGLLLIVFIISLAFFRYAREQGWL